MSSKAPWPEDWSVEFPGRKCREPVWNGDMPHSCDLADNHGGSCASQSVVASIQRRNTYLRELEEQ